MRFASSCILKLLGILLLAAAVLKGWQLCTEPVANNTIWSYRPFLILTIEFELILAILLLSGLFRKAAWLACLVCFLLFSMITLHKAITGVESCGCFGSIHMDPWTTLFAIDLPAVIALAIFRPRLLLSQEHISTGAVICEFLTPLPSVRRLATAVVVALTVFGSTVPILALNEPPKTTSRYEVLEPETWVGKRLPILEHIDIAKSLKKGTWLVLFHHHDCPDCAQVVPEYKQIAHDLKGNEDFLQIALIAMPPYSQDPAGTNSPCTLGRMAMTKEWFVTTPAVVLLNNGQVTNAWEEEAPDFNNIIEAIAPANGSHRQDVLVQALVHRKPVSEGGD